MTLITLVIPCHNEAGGIVDTIQRIRTVTSGCSYDFEFVLVDDGSTDETWEQIQSLKQTVTRLQGISFSRNFGKEHAIIAGLQASTGEAAIVCDADLQHPPELIVDMLGAWSKQNVDIVHGVKQNRQNDSYSNTFVIRIFYFLHRITTGTSLAGASDFKLLSRRAIDAYLALPEHEPFFRGLVPWLGFTQIDLPFTVGQRSKGESKWSNRKRFVLALNTIISFSTLPLQLVTMMGVIFLFGALLLIIQTLYTWFTGGALEGFSTVIILLLITGAVIMISLGIIGQYIARIYTEVRHRPTFVVKETV